MVFLGDGSEYPQEAGSGKGDQHKAARSRDRQQDVFG